MKDQEKTKEQLISEVEELRRQVTTLAAAEQDRKRLENDLDLTFRLSPMLMCVAGLDGYLKRVNPVYQATFAYTHEELLTRPYIEFMHPDDHAAFIAHINQLASGIPVFNVETRIRRPDGSVRLILWTGIPMTEAGTVLCIGQDITGPKQAEKELAKSRAMLQATIDCLPFTFFAIGRDGRYTMQNAVSRAQHRADVVGKLPEEVCPNEEDLAIWADNNRRAFAGEKVEGEVALWLGGEERFYYNVIAPVTDGTDSYGILGVNIDITERKRAELALKGANDGLERRVEERTAELAKANEELTLFRRFAEASGQGFGMADLDGHLLYLNPALCRMLDEERPEDRIGQHLSIYFSAESNRRGKQEIEPALMREGYWQGELSMLSRQGRSIPTWHNSFVIRDDAGSPIRLAVVITDITARKAAEDALRASEERFRVTFEEAPVGMATGSADGVIAKANRAICRMFGYRQEELVGRHVRDLVHPEDRELSAPLLKRFLAGEIASFTLEKRYLRKDGSPFWAQATTMAAHGPDSTIVFALGVLEDITERKRAEEALRQSERRFRNYFEQGLIGMAVTAVDKRWLEVNDRLCKMLGYSREELLQTNWLALTHPDDVEPNLRLLNSLRAGEIDHFTLDKRYLKKDGGIVYATIHTRAFRKDDRTIDHIVTLIEDITQRRQAEEALRASTERYELAVRGAGVGIWDWDIRTGKVYYSPRWKMLFGYDESDIGNGVDDWARLLHPAERDWVLKFQDAFLAGTSPTVTAEYRLRHKDGFYRWIVAHGLAVRDEQGRAYRLVGSHGDITDRKRAEEALERERQSLWRMLQASDHERQIISYDIHDGLAQYLAAAAMQLQVHDSLQENSPAEAKKACETALELVRQSHAEARRLINVVRPPVIDEEGIETAMAHLVHEQRRQGGPQIEFDSSVQFDCLPPILENAMYRIIQEALTNACKHSHSKEVKVSMIQEGQNVRLQVRDWGIGFDPGAVGQGHFGLEGIRQRVRLLGGRLTIESTLGSGTMIQVLVPIVEQQKEE